MPDFQAIMLPLLQSCADGQEHGLRETKHAALQADILRVDREIDGVVYGLYGLGVEEVKIIEKK